MVQYTLDLDRRSNSQLRSVRIAMATVEDRKDSGKVATISNEKQHNTNKIYFILFIFKNNEGMQISNVFFLC